MTVCMVSFKILGDKMLYIIFLAKFCCPPLIDDFKVVAQNERITKYIMKMNLVLYYSL